MKNIARKVALVSSFAMIFSLVAISNNILGEIQNNSIVASAEDTTYTVQNIYTIQDDDCFITESPSYNNFHYVKSKMAMICHLR